MSDEVTRVRAGEVEFGPEYIGTVRKRADTFLGATSVTVDWSMGEQDASIYLDARPTSGASVIRVTIGEIDYGYPEEDGCDCSVQAAEFTPEQARALAHDLPLILTELAQRAEQ